MPGIPTHFVILDKTIKSLKGSPDAALRAIAGVMERQSAYAHLGAIGPTIGDFIPSGPGAVPQYVKVWHNLFNIVGGYDSQGHPGLFRIVKRMYSYLDELDPIANSEDVDDLKAFEPKLGELSDTSGALTILLNELQTRATRIIVRINASGPAVNVKPNQRVPDLATWYVRDVLHSKHPGKFTQQLLTRAKASGDERFLAYAYGYVTAYAGKACGSPFINSIVLGPYRTQWWRHRWVQNWVDAWVWGAATANPVMANDTPTPAYSDPAWAPLCNAQLHKQIEIPGSSMDPRDLMNRLPQGLQSEEGHKGHDPFPVLMPPEFGAFWVDAYAATYGPLPADTPVKADKLNDAYIMLWLMLWFQTSAFMEMNAATPPAGTDCLRRPSMTPPGDCSGQPSWADPNVPGSNGAGGAPPLDGDYEQVDTAEEVCGWILAILGGLATLVGALPIGAAGIGIGAGLIIDAHSVDWKKLRCDLYWYRMYLYNSLRLIHQVLVLAGLEFPEPAELEPNQQTVQRLGKKYDSGPNLCKSRARREGFPAEQWAPEADLLKAGTWTALPTTWEEPQQVAYLSTEYPSFFVDAAANPLSNGRIRNGGPWPPGYRANADGLPVQFGSAVQNAVDLFEHLGDTFPDWNLDADRGLAYFTWQFHNGLYTIPVQIDPEA